MNAVSPALRVSDEFDAQTPRTISGRTISARATKPDFARELWLGMPKGGKTLHGSDAEFLSRAGFTVDDRISRVDDYRLVDGPEFADIGVRAIEMKPRDALALIASRRMDAAIVGRDVLKEFNASMRGRKGLVQCVEIVDLDIAPCTLSICVPEDDGAATIDDLQGRFIVTKYRDALENWAKRKGIQFGEIISEIVPGMPISGGIEGYRLFDPRVNAICDMVESGESIVRYGMKPLGIANADWAPICADVDLPKGERRKYTDLPRDVIENLPGTVLPSRPVLVRSGAKLSDEKEKAISVLIERFIQASQSLGRSPVQHNKRVGNQRSYKAGRKIERLPSRDGEIGHARWHLDI